MIVFVSLFGLDFGALVGGAALLTEVVFGLQASANSPSTALQNLDLPVIMATVLYAAFFVVLANALVDILYARSIRGSAMSDRPGCSTSTTCECASIRGPARHRRRRPLPFVAG